MYIKNESKGKAENEVFLHFYKEIRGDYDRYLDILRSFNQEHDFFIIDEDHLGLVVADVSGKGVPASVSTAPYSMGVNFRPS